jgi:hypothetical protein
MLNTAEKNELMAQKQLLVAESEINRQALRLQFSRVQSSFSGITRVMESGRAMSPLLMLAGTLAGFAFKKTNWKAILSKALFGWKAVQFVRSLWGRGRKPAREEGLDLPPIE